jgi:uncharacterized protein
MPDTSARGGRASPSVVLAVVAIVAYLFVLTALAFTFPVKYTQIADSPHNLLFGVVIPVGTGGLVLCGLATWWGWWRPALYEGRRFGPTWALISPALLVLAYLLNLGTTNFARLTLGFLLLAALGTLLVGFSEELLMRGLVLVGLRGSLSEGWVWLATSAVFGLLHGINYFYGQPLAATAVQIAFATLLGSIFYVTRMLTGTLLIPMALHALNDFSAFLIVGTGSSGLIYSVVVEGVAEVIALIAVRQIIAAKMADRRGRWHQA